MDDIAELYEKAEQLFRDDNFVESKLVFEDLFQKVKVGESADDRSRARIFANRLAKLCTHLNEFENAKMYYEYLGENIPQVVRTALRHQASAHSASPRNLVVSDPLIESLSSVIAVAEFESLASRFEFFKTKARLQQPSSMPVDVEVSFNQGTWTARVIDNNKRSSFSSKIESCDGRFEESRSDTSLVETLARIKRASRENPVLDIGSIVFETDGIYKDDSAQLCALRMWCYLFDEPAPDANQFNKARADYLQSTQRRLELAKQELLAGTGVVRWNEMSLEDWTSVKLAGEDFSDCNLNGIRFFGIDLSSSCFDRCSMEGALLSHVKLTGASFRNSSLNNSRFANCCLHNSDFRAASLIESSFFSSDLTGAIFDDSNMSQSRINGSYGAQLVLDASFRNARLASARFVNADVCGANFADADLTQTVFVDTKYDESTVFPINPDQFSGLIKVGPAKTLNSVETVVQTGWAIGRLTQFLSQLNVQLEQLFGAVAAPEALEEIEALLGAKLPEDYKYFLKTVGGQTRPFVHRLDFLSADEARVCYSELVDNPYVEFDQSSEGALSIQGPVKDLYKNRLWWPIIRQSDDFICLDMDPDKGGYHGQVLYVVERAYRTVIAKSFADFITSLVNVIESNCGGNADDLDDENWRADGFELSDELESLFSYNLTRHN